ncbi:MAG TPA: CHC2 zinc finger domain-containing protein [Jatrophihabitans sp.]|nr:CHC2 zinc finger domain-containing protein [Jatrophihabitans sp.]
MSRVDVDELRRQFPLAEVVAASGLTLHPRGAGFIACCPFHDDDTPSLSVEGVPGRFHCFGCGASCDVIDYIARTHHLDFLAAAAHLTRPNRPNPALPAPQRRPLPAESSVRTSRERILQLNTLAWDHFTQPGKVIAAERYLRDVRGIDPESIRAATGGAHVVGLATRTRDGLTTHLLRAGARREEIVDAGLAVDRGGRLIDTYRGRVLVPVRDPHGGIEGFLGRDITGHPSAPKYLNPTRTPAYDKSRSLYWPLGRPPEPTEQVVIVEGFIDALAIAAGRRLHVGKVFPCSASGISVSTHQAQQVTTLTCRPVLLALDADTAGKAGAHRWTQQLHQLNRTTQTLALPSGTDPAQHFGQSPDPDLSI